MDRKFYIFTPGKDGLAVALIENGIPQAMSNIDSSLVKVKDQDDLNLLNISIVRAFGQSYPVSAEDEEKSWVN